MYYGVRDLLFLIDYVEKCNKYWNWELGSGIGRVSCKLIGKDE